MFIGETCKVTLWNDSGCKGKKVEKSANSIKGKELGLRYQNWGAYSLKVGPGCVRVKVWDDDDGSWGAHPQNKFYPYDSDKCEDLPHDLDDDVKALTLYSKA